MPGTVIKYGAILYGAKRYGQVVDYAKPLKTFSVTQGYMPMQIELAWAEQDGDYNYAGLMLRRSTVTYPASILEGDLVGSFAAGVRRHTDEGLTAGQAYFYTAFPYNFDGDYSGYDVKNTGYAISSSTKNYLNEVKNLVAVALEDAISLSWYLDNRMFAYVSKYNIYKRVSGVGSYVFLEEIPFRNSYEVNMAYLAEGLSPSTAYDFKITTVLSSGIESEGMTVTHKTSALSIPDSLKFHMPKFMNTMSGELQHLLHIVGAWLQDVDFTITTQAMPQLNITSSRGEFLQGWGDFLGIKRYPEESEESYANRIILNTLRPRVNNIALENLLRPLSDNGIVSVIEPKNLSGFYTGTVLINTRSNERYLIPIVTPYTITPMNKIKKTTPSVVKVWSGVDRTGTQYSETTGSPSPGQYKINYIADGGNGGIVFNVADVGKTVYISYLTDTNDAASGFVLTGYSTVFSADDAWEFAKTYSGGSVEAYRFLVTIKPRITDQWFKNMIENIIDKYKAAGTVKIMEYTA